MKQHSFKLGSATLIVALFGSALTATAGSLTPPSGPIQPTNRIQINQQFGGLPIIIDQPGSYVLTGNIVAPAGYTGHGIEINASDVTLDLNGFAVIGVTESSHGIRLVPGIRENITVRNGTVSGWGFTGVRLSFGRGPHQVDNVRAINNFGRGIVVSDNTTDGKITNCIASNNVNGGIFGGGQTTIRHCIAIENGSDGISVFGGQATVIDCIASGNARFGISIFEGSAIGNTCNSNGSSGDTGGIEVAGPAHVEGNHLIGNEPFGIAADFGGGSTIVKNVVTGSSFNYSISSGNDVGPIGTAAASTSPWANISN